MRSSCQASTTAAANPVTQAPRTVAAACRRPARSARRAICATAMSWVMVMSAAPVSCVAASSIAITSSPVWTSKAPVGSSARTTLGPRTSARAIATRCCSPPDSRSGIESIRPPSPTRSSIEAAMSRRCQNDVPPAYISGAATFSSAVRPGNRLNCWNTKPMSRPRIRAARRADSARMSSPSHSMVPVVGRSRSPSRFSSVDLPLPERPMMPTWSPAEIVRSTPVRMCSSLSSVRCTVRVTSDSRSNVLTPGTPPRPGCHRGRTQGCLRPPSGPS